MERRVGIKFSAFFLFVSGMEWRIENRNGYGGVEWNTNKL